ncbi:MAG: RluA family pseudouridine synthase [Deltaproteobacteria bacterium]|nr:RluA family pseudouridine synthase [Deltaproteobacteria bacterium]
MDAYPPLPVLREERAWIAVDKPPGLPVVAGRQREDRVSVRRALEVLRCEPLWVVHRLDRGTSGVLLLARTAEAHRALSMAFEAGAVEKTYLAICQGTPPSSSGVVDVPLHAARKGKVRPAEAGEPGSRAASTAWRVLCSWNRPEGTVCLVEAHPRTGRTHQVRVHLRWLGLPLALDPLYGPRTPCLPLIRTPLHAAVLSFPDPTSGTRVVVTAPLAGDLQAVLRSLERNGETTRSTADPPGRTVSDQGPGAGRGWAG